jgi:hypothetical protein
VDMAKEFYTERDIEDMVKRGQRSLIVNDHVVLTDLAYEKSRRLGVQLIQQEETPPAAPIRPYLNKSTLKAKPADIGVQPRSKIDLIKANVKAAVHAKFGSEISDELLDRVIDRVAAELGFK